MTLAYEVSDDIAARMAQRIQPTFGYYRQPNGWIKVSPNTRLERLKYVEQGWVYLEAYGAFDMTAYTANHPLEGLFMFGGAKELPVEQILQMGLYIDPALVPRCRQHLTQLHRAHRAACWRGATPVEFPQLADVPKELIGPFVCDFCKRKMPTREALAQHQSVAHAEPLGNIRTGDSLGKAVAKALSQFGQAPAAPETPAVDTGVLLQRIADLEGRLATQPTVAPKPMTACVCGGQFKQGGGNLHKRSKRHRDYLVSNRSTGQVTQPA